MTRSLGIFGSLASLNLPQSEGPNYYSNTNQITSWNGRTAAADSASNLTTDPVRRAAYAWDSRNQLSSINTTSFTEAYDAVIRRYDQTAAFGGTTTYLRDQKNVAQSETGNSNPLNNYLTMAGTGEVLTFTTAGSTYVPLHDRLGSTIGLVNSSNSLHTQYTYDPFGNEATSGTASSYSYLFAGIELDSSGLYHTQTRCYSPALGRFLSPDAGLPANAFTYADDDPVNATDPTGMSSEHFSGGGMSPAPSDDAGWAAGSNPAGGGGLAGAMLAQDFCANEVCAVHTGNSNSSGSLLGDLIGFFISLFGGGGGQPAIQPPGYRRRAHYPAIYLLPTLERKLKNSRPPTTRILILSRHIISLPETGPLLTR
jgi:RHS repeat-associated protein